MGGRVRPLRLPPHLPESDPVSEDGLILKEEGIALALSRHALFEWKREFRRVVRMLAKKGSPFTSEDVLEYTGLPNGDITTNANNAVGAMMNAMAKEGWIRKTNERSKATRPTSHGRELAVWVGEDL